MNKSGSSGQAGVTDLLNSVPGRQNELYELVYSHLKAIAKNRLSSENRKKTLQTTALVNEAYLRLARQKSTWRDRKHFYGVAAEAMRRILIDAARSRMRLKRGGELTQRSLIGLALPGCEWESQMLELNEFLVDLEKELPEYAEVVRLRFFSCLTYEECAEVLNVSVSTVERRWRFARAWLHAKIDEKV